MPERVITEYLPRQFSVDRIVRSLQLEEAHPREAQGVFPLSSELFQPAHDEQHINR